MPVRAAYFCAPIAPMSVADGSLHRMGSLLAPGQSTMVRTSEWGPSLPLDRPIVPVGNLRIHCERQRASPGRVIKIIGPYDVFIDRAAQKTRPRLCCSLY